MSGEAWVVLDYDGKPLPGEWPTEERAVDEGLCSRYLLSGFEVARSLPVGPDSGPHGVSTR